MNAGAEGSWYETVPPASGGGDVSPTSITDAVVSWHKPTFNSGRIEGTLRVLLGESFTIGGNTQITSDLYLPGTPTIQLSGSAQDGGTVSDGGSASPASYTVSLTGSVNLPGRIHTHVDAIQLPTDFPTSMPAPSGTRIVTVHSQSEAGGIGDWLTVRDLNVTGAHITINVPPGNYGTFTINGNSQLNFTAGTYNFLNTFNLDGSATLQATGLVAINVGQNLTVNSGAVALGSYTSPGDLHLNVMGSLLNVNGSSQVSGLVRAYNGTVTLNGTSQVRGQVIANSITLAGGKVIGAVWPAQSACGLAVFGPRRFDRTTGPPNQYVEQFALPSGVSSPYTLHIQNGELSGSNRVSSATVKLNGADVLTPSDLNQNVAGLDRTVTLAANNQLDVRVESSPGSYLIINICGTVPVSDTTPPTISITSPANNSTTTATQTTVTGTATDLGPGASGVAHVYVNNVEAAYNSADGTWTISNVPLALGSNQITARAVDQAGNQVTASITVTRQSPTNHAPTADAGPDQTLTLPQTASLHGSATDDGLPAGSTLTTTWSKVAGPGTVTFINANALNTTASFSSAGTYVLRLTATDGALSTTDDVTITVQPQNQPPTVSAGPDQMIALPHTATLNGTVTDDGLPAPASLTTAWSEVSGPGTVTFEDATSTDTNATFSVAGTYVLRLTANDGELSAKSDVTITVQPENHAPTVSAGQNQTVSLPNPAVQLNGSAADDGLPFGSSLTFSWSMVSGPGSVVFDNPNSTTTVAHFAVAGTYVLRLTATDGELSSNADVNITVTQPNQAPTVNAGADQAVTLPNVANLNGTVGDDGLPLGGSVSTLWSTVSGPGTVTFANPNVTVTAASFSAAGTYVLRLSASDSQLSSSDDVVITVNPQNQPPTVNAGADQTVTSCTANLQGTVTDDGIPAGATLTTLWSKVSGPGNVTFSSPENLITAATFSAGGTYVLRLTASDSQLTGADELAITVNLAAGAPSPPHYFDPTPYLSFQDSPFRNIAFSNFYLEDFEDHLLNTPGVTANTGGVTGVIFGPGYHDSVDADDGVIDGHGAAGDSYFSYDGGSGIKFTFNASVLGSLPTYAGLVWTDGAGDVYFEAFDRNGVSMGLRGPFNLPDGVYVDTTAEDRFLGAYNPDGISAIRVLNTIGGLEVDHLQYGFGGNGAPVVNAGPDQTVQLPVTTSNLNGSVTDDGLPACGTLSISWSKVSGPGTVTFANPNAAATTATFSAPGAYVLRLTANDGQLNSSDDVAINITTNQPPVADFGLPTGGGLVQLALSSYSSYYNDGYESYHPKQVLDPSPYTAWLSNSYQVTNQLLTFRTSDGQPALIDRARMQSYYAGGDQNVKDFEIQVSSASDSPADFHTVFSGTLLQAGTDFQEFVFPGGPVSARYIKLVLKNNYGSGNNMTFATFQVIATGSADGIISFLGQPNSAANQSPALVPNGGAIYDFSYGGGTNTADQMLGYYRGGWITTTSVNQFAIVQLGGGKVYTLDGVKLATWYDSGYGYPTGVKDFEIWVSATTPDAAAFTRVLTSTVAFDPRLQTFLFPGGPVQAKFVKYVPLNNGSGGPVINTQVFDVVAEGVAKVVASSGQLEYATNPPEQAFDGNANTFWYGPNGAGSDVWVKTSLEDETIHKVYGVRITPLNSYYYGLRGPKDFDIRVSTTTTDESAFTTVYSGTLDGAVSNNAQEFVFSNPVDAKYVEFYWKNSYSGFQIAVSELEVMASSAHGSTLIGYSSSNDPSYQGPTNALDIDLTNPWFTASGQNSDQWLKLLLPNGDLWTIDHVALMPGVLYYGYNGNQDLSVSPKDFEVQVSTTTADDSAFSTVGSGTLTNTLVLQYFYFPQTQARYVRLVLKNNYGSDKIALNSFYVFTTDHGSTDARFVDRSTDSDGNVVAWSWNFGDGGSSTEQTPLHHYAAAGTYTVTLTVTDNGGLTGSHQLIYHASPPIGADFAFSPVISHEGGEDVRFTDVTKLLMQQQAGQSSHRLWDFGNGYTVTDLYQATYPYRFPDSGTFNATMTIGDPNGIRYVVTKPVTVLNLAPAVGVQPGQTVVWGEQWTNAPQIFDQSPIDSQTLHGLWDFGDGQTSTCNNCNNASGTITHAYTLPGVYNATLTVTDKDGGAGSASTTYTVNRRPTALVFQTPPSQSNGSPVVIHARLLDTFGNQPLSGKPVQFTLNGATINGVTGADGVAEVSVPLPAGTRIDIITGTFAGDSLYLNCGGVGVPVTAGGAPPAGTLGNQGTNFWLMFPHDYFDGYGLAIQRLYISSRVDTNGTVTIPGAGFNFTQNFTVQANTITTVQLPFVQVYESDVIQDKGIHLIAQQPVTVYGLNQRVFTSDAFLGLPVNTLGSDHFVLTYSNMGFSPTSEVGMVATENGTTVTITPAATTGSRAAGVPYNVTLNQGQTYLLQNTVPTTAGDLTGSRVSSNKPIAVFAGHAAATIPAEAGCCADHLVEQLPPTNVWGKRFATVPLATRIKGDFFRIIASQDGTAVYLNGNLTAMLDRGQWVEKIIKDPAEIIATNPIMVAQYSTSIFYDYPTTGKADPFEMIIPPYSQFLNHYTVSTPGTGFQINYANVVAPTASLGSITLDGAPISASSFTPIGVSGYSGAQIPITVGMHNLDGPASFGVFVYGFNQDEGYGYPGGMNMSASVQSVNVVVTPETSDRPINAQACVLATVTNQDQIPLGGKTITFTVTGANPSSSSATTDAAGQAQFCYTGTHLGSDLVTAAVGSASGTASVQWLTNVPNQAPVVNAGADQTINLPAPVTLSGSVTDDGLPSNTLNISWSKVSGPGNVTFANSASVYTTATVTAAGVYVLRLTASDSSLSASDDVQMTVNPTPTNHAPAANAGPDLSAAIKGNLIVNPGNEEPLVNGKIPGWIEEQGTTWTQGNSSIAGLPDPHRGNSFFYVGSDGAQYAELRQDIDVSAFASTIAAGTQQFEIQAFIRQAGEFPSPDYPQVTLEYRNAQNDGIVGSLNSYSTYTPGSWSPVQAVNTVPAGTGWIRVRLIATRNQGVTNDAYFDSISLRPVGNTAVKLNGAVTDDGLPYGSSVSANWTQVSGPAAVTFSNSSAANSQALFTTPGTYGLRLTAGDGQLNASDDVTVTINPANQPPSVGGGSNQTITLPDTASLSGIISDDGLPVGSTVSSYWAKNQGPGIVTFTNPNAASTTASFSTPGFYILTLTADDSEYASTNYNFYVSVNPAANNQPPTVNAGPDKTITLPTNTVALNGAAADDGLPSGSTVVVQWTQVSGPALASFANPNTTVTTAQFSTAGTYVLRLNASDGQLTNSDDVTITVTGQNQPPTVNAGADSSTVLSQPVQLDGSASDDGLPAGSTLTTTWSKFSGPGTVTFGNVHAIITGAQFSATGTYVLRLTASDGALSVSDDVTITVNDDVPPPTVQITAPADDSSITEPTIVTGSVSGGAWTLEYSLDSTDDQNSRVWTTFASGNGAASGTLGTLDPTMMLNGLFDIRLSSTDQFGQTSRTRISVIVERNLKVGNFTVSFTDLSIPVAGVPMEVARTYDSRDKRVGDFGFGWTLGLNNIRVEKSSVVGLKWYETVSQEVFPNYCLEPVGSHTVSVTFPGGKVFKFQPSVTPHCQRNAPITSANISFTAMPGTVGKLEVIGSSDVQIDGSVPGPVNLIGFGSGVDIFNSFVFKFTAEDGTAYIIDQRTGLQSLADLNGNTLTIGAGGIVHSSGKSIVFHRDIVGRIESITDPNGNSMFYHYDPNGDLVSYTDNENNTSTYTYDANHRLLTIHDPRGIQPIRNDYDPSGRLISHTDAFGKLITYVHDVANRTETVIDRLGHPTVYNYDERGNVLTKTDARGGVTSFTYDANDNVLTETNALGKTTTYTYDENDHRTSIKDPLNNLTQFTYNVLGKVLTTTDPLNHVTTNTYDSAGRLKTTEDPLHNMTSYIYGVFDGQLISSTDALNHATQYEYTGPYLTKQTDALGNEIIFSYDNNGNRKGQTVKRTNAQGQLETITSNYDYDKLNRLTKTTFADGSFVSVEYNNGGRQSATVDQGGRRVEMFYDEMNRLIRKDYPDGTHEDTTYDAEGHKLTSKDRLGRVTSFTYDELGRMTKTTYNDGSFVQTTFDAIGRVATSVGANNNVTTYEYDPNCGCSGRRSKITDALGHITTFTYDGAGRQITMTDALDHTTTNEYDASGRRTKIIHPDNTFDLVGYDALGRVISRTDQAGKTTQFTLDALGRLIKVTDALGKETQYKFDEAGNQIEQTDALNHTTRYEYDSLGRPTKRTLPLGQSESLSYAADGNLLSKTDFNGNTTSFGYDLMGQLLSKTPDPSLNQPAVTFTYRANGQRATMNDASGLTVYSYDNRNRLVSKQTPQGTLSYTYDVAGKLLTTRSSNPNGLSLDYSYDVLGRPATVKDNSLAALNGGVTNYTYDAVGNLQGYSTPNGVTSSYAYNSLNRLTTMTVGTQASSLASYSYTLGAAGNRTAVNELGGRTITYTYDDLYRLTSESVANDPNSANGTVSYAYDSVGNRLGRTSSIVPVPSQSHTYDANDRSQVNTYDNEGNTRVANGNNYTYDFENHLTSANSGSVSYVYDGDGKRVSKTSHGVTTRYLVDTNNLTGYAQVADELTNGQVTRTYSYGFQLLSQRQLINNQWQVSFYGQDGSGNVRSLTDINGLVTDSYTYDAFGNLIASTGNTPNERLYGGEEFDPDLGFYYLRARYMDPDVGRFITMDSIAGDNSSPMSLHKYLYANSDPVNRRDPSGHMSVAEQVGVIAVASVIAAIATFALFTSLAKHYLPSDAFTKWPDGVVFGFQGNYPLDKFVPGTTAYGQALKVGLQFMALVGGVDGVVTYAAPGTAWTYLYLGLSSGFPQSAGFSGYVGFVWNVSKPEDYAGPFFCTTATPHSIFASLGFSTPASLCTSPGGAYSVTMTVAATGGPLSSGTLMSSGTAYSYQGDWDFAEPVPRTVNAAVQIWQAISHAFTQD